MNWESAVLRKKRERNYTNPVTKHFAARNRTVNVSLIGNAAVSAPHFPQAHRVQGSLSASCGEVRRIGPPG